MTSGQLDHRQRTDLRVVRRLGDFEGAWSLSRIISQADGPVCRFEGTATWRPEGERLAYEETGEMRMPGQPPMRAERRYLWDADLAVLFPDGRFFHSVPPRGGRAEHRCAPDHYVASYDFAEWPAFRVTWEVSGPRKAYRSVTRYRR